MEYPDRRTYIGGSDAKVIAGVDTRKSIFRLFHEKTGAIEPEPVDNEYIYWGTILEPAIVQAYTDRTGTKTRRLGYTKHPKHPFIGGHLDRQLIKTPGGLEIKNRNSGLEWMYGDEADGSEAVPEDDLIQVQHYLSLKPRFEFMDLCVLFGGNKLRIYRIDRDAAIIDSLTRLEVEFWMSIGKGKPPALDYAHPDTKAILQRLYPGTSGDVLVMPKPLEEAHRRYQEANAELKDARAATREVEKKREAAQNELMAYMGEASLLLPPGEGAYTRRIVHRKPTEATSYLMFRFKKSTPDILTETE